MEENHSKVAPGSTTRKTKAPRTTKAAAATGGLPLAGALVTPSRKSPVEKRKRAATVQKRASTPTSAWAGLPVATVTAIGNRETSPIRRKKAYTKVQLAELDDGGVDVKYEKPGFPAYIFNGPQQQPFMLFLKALGNDYYEKQKGRWTRPAFIAAAFNWWENQCDCLVTYWEECIIKEHPNHMCYVEVEDADARKDFTKYGSKHLQCPSIPGKNEGLQSLDSKPEQDKFKSALDGKGVKKCLEVIEGSQKQEYPMTLYELKHRDKPENAEVIMLLKEIHRFFLVFHKQADTLFASRQDWKSCRDINNGRREVLLPDRGQAFEDDFFGMLVEQCSTPDFPLLSQLKAQGACGRLMMHLRETVLPDIEKHHRQEFCITNTAFIMNYTEVDRQVGHVDLRAGYHNGSMSMEDDTTRTTVFRQVGPGKIRNMEDLVRHFGSKDDEFFKELLTISNQWPEDKALVDHVLKSHGHCLLPHEEWRCEESMRTLSCGDNCGFPGATIHAGPAVKEYRCILFYAVCPKGGPDYDDTIQLSESSLWATILAYLFHALRPEMRAKMLDRVLHPLLPCPKIAANLRGEMRELLNFVAMFGGVHHQCESNFL